MTEWLAEAERLKEAGLSYERIGRRVGQSRSTVYYHLKAKSQSRKEAKCRGCGKSFRAYDLRRVYCSRECWSQHAPSPALRPEVADKIALAKTKHGRTTRRRHRQLKHAGFTLQAKGETECRVCGSDDYLALHHAIPRSMWKAGIAEPLNGIALCIRCHFGWHARRVVIYRDVFTPDEWACISSAELLGQNVTAWLDDRYPVRQTA